MKSATLEPPATKNPETGLFSDFILNQTAAMHAAMEVFKFRSNDMTARIHNSWRDKQTEFVAWVNFHQLFSHLAEHTVSSGIGILVVNMGAYDALVHHAGYAANAGFLPVELYRRVPDFLLEYCEAVDPADIATVKQGFDGVALKSGQRWVNE